MEKHILIVVDKSCPRELMGKLADLLILHDYISFIVRLDTDKVFVDSLRELGMRFPKEYLLNAPRRDGL
jgi:hypothetical protein